MSSQPIVSIGLPIYNGERFLAETIESLLAQTFEDFELIISDNGSTDATEEICRSHQQTDRRIRYYREDENRGAAWNYNRVLELATAEYFKWAADDDVLEPRYLEACLEALRAEPGVVLAYPRGRVIDEHGAVLYEHWDQLDLREPAAHQRIKHLVWNPPNMGTSVFGVTPTAALRQTRGHGDYVSADYIILAELALLGQFREVPEILFLRRFHPGMSRHSESTLSEVAEWFRPGGGDRVILEYWGLFRQHLFAIARSPLSAFEKLRCAAVFIPNWLRVWHRLMGSELLQLPAQFRRLAAGKRRPG